MTIDNIKKACEKHFAHRVGKNVCCHVLSGEQGPSCKTSNQIPSSKLIHVHFVPRSTIDVADDVAGLGSTSSLPPAPSVLRKRKMESISETCSSRFPEAKRPFSKESPSKCYPKSLSVLDMIKLGMIVDSCRTTVVRLYSFDIDLMTWSKVPKTVEFLIEEQPLGQGGFRSAYKATSQNVDFKNSCWVIKKYLPNAVAIIEATNHTL